MISDLIREANDTFNGRLHLQHVEKDKNPPKGISLKMPLIFTGFLPAAQQAAGLQAAFHLLLLQQISKSLKID